MDSANAPQPTARPPLWDLTAWRALYPGMWAWLLQRLSAVAVLVLFPLHVINPYVDWIRVAMLACVTWHAMHGIKVLLTDFGFPARHQRKLLAVLSVLALVLFLGLVFLHRGYWRFLG